MMPVRVEFGEMPMPPIPTGSVKMRTYGFFDDQMVEWFGLTVHDEWHGDFDHCDMTCRFSNGQTQSNAIANYQKLSADEMNFLWAIQPDDYSIYSATLKQKKNWLYYSTGDYKRPYWQGPRYGAMVFGHSYVRVGAERTEFMFTSPTGKKGMQPFRRLDGFTREMMDMELGAFTDYEYDYYPVSGGEVRKVPTIVRKNVIPLIEAGIVQACTEPNENGTISCTHNGVKLHIVWSPNVWVPKPDGEYYIWEGALYA